jgi:AcrR family transcriptional regulator
MRASLTNVSTGNIRNPNRLAASSGNVYIGNMAEDHARPYHHGNLKEVLVQAGIDLLEERGLTSVSLRAIAARAGVSHAAPRNHFGSLRGLFTAIATEGFRRHAAAMRDGVDSATRAEDRQQAALVGYVRFAANHPALFQLMFSDTLCDLVDPALQQAARASYDVLSEIAAGLDWDKADTPDAQRRAEMMLWSLAHGYATLANAGAFFGQTPGQAPALSVLDIAPRFPYRPG